MENEKNREALPYVCIDASTRLIALLGRPVAHSLSPVMHNTAFAQKKLPYVYLAFDTGRGQLTETVAALRRLHARGFNTTMPLKNDMARLCDTLSPAADAIGAVNTVVIEDDGTLSGTTTDGIGLLRAVREAGISVAGEKITLFGGGGAASAILAQAAYDGVREISVFSRAESRFTPRLKALTGKLRQETDCRIEIFDYEEASLRRALSESRLLVNATSTGMASEGEKTGERAACLVPDASYLSGISAVADCVYHPLETPLLSLAKQVGAKTVTGLSMLLYQGAEAFRLWTGEEMPVELIRQQLF